MNNIQKTDIKLLIVISIIVTTVLSTTYALLNFDAQSTTNATQSGCFVVDYTGSVLTSNSLVSTTDYTKGSHATVTLKKNSGCQIYTKATISLYTDTNSNAPLNGVQALKYKVMSGSTEVATGVIKNTATTDISPKNFAVNLATVNLTTTATTYDIYIWIDKSISHGEYHSKTYSGYIYATSEQTSTIK